MAAKVNNAHLVFALKLTIHFISLFLLVTLYIEAANDQLGADPVEAVLHFTGIGAFNLLLLSLLVSPLAQQFKWSHLLKVRRLIGLYSFTYALCHLLSFLAFEVQFDWGLFINEIIERPYISVGMLAVVILFLLTITSFSMMKKKMGRNWQTLHNGVYVALCFVALHFYWSVKSDVIEPSIYIAMCVFLLYFRRRKIRRWFHRS
ncbi:protein-methionine-sulfoxide reductase heme-binding subunit MsrQ [Colwellia sp. 1_MG-2023]|uniref:protein-methionine-sulfoxide reductase heme-binding subunit MsrQ n=1 Tax=Colwellia sp. 1_MG-2023 TaxID=3062649 RepID=UPI0026E23F65|nr:protein-methionine-sulfoxide reductase heme-binding subunit MsrQ [Colwellia sp. 1_MG-2023]MDO6444506.1 protein-methionine-sulfoxide reductase heme-binding subunit MsrQ [Colwellia sp. 1_MG-2023]